MTPKTKKNNWKSGSQDCNLMESIEEDPTHTTMADGADGSNKQQHAHGAHELWHRDEASWGDMTSGDDKGNDSSTVLGDLADRDKQKVDAEVKGLVRRETRAVALLRVLVISMLLLAACVTSYFVYAEFKDKEYDSFLEEYRAVSTRIIDLFRNDILQKLWVAQSLANSATAMIEAQQLQAPNLTIYSFDSLVQASVKLAPVGTVKWAPLLQGQEDIDQFAAYVLSEQAKWGNQTEGDDDEEEEASEHEDNDRLLLSQLSANLSSPVWQVSPSYGKGHKSRLYDLMSNPIFSNALEAMIQSQGPVMTEVYTLGPSETDESEDEDENDEDESEDEHGESEDDRRRRRRLDSDSDSEDDAGDGMERAMTLFFPVFENEQHTKIVGSIGMEILWSDYLSGYLLVEGGEELDYAENVFDTDEVDAILENTCGQVFTTIIDESSIIFKTEGDAHDTNFDDLYWGTSFEEFAIDFGSFGQSPDNQELHDNDPFHLVKEALSPEAQGEQCFYRLVLYPNQELVDEHLTNDAILFSLGVAAIFLFTSSLFVFYDLIVSRRQRIITKQAIRTNAIVASLYPEQVRNRLMVANEGDSSAVVKKFKGIRLSSKPQTNFNPTDTDPIADLFPECTCLFADIAGFTAWSSEREPPQVFRLLERTFNDFDKAAKRLGVFKVETIGDCYVAVVGLPTPRDDHAVIGAVFARAIIRQMKILLKDLEKVLGPSTTSLDLRVGLHSGPVTAGVLRGEKSRFQLFGDTMNVCSRMESSGRPGMIHLSSTCADKLKEAGFGEWLSLREDTQMIKGKGIMQTYWLRTREGSCASSSVTGDETNRDLGASDNVLMMHHPSSHEDKKEMKKHAAKVQRLVQWNVQLLSSVLQAVIARRSSERTKDSTQAPVERKLSEHTGPVIGEVKEILALPKFDAKACRNQLNPASITLSPEVMFQLTSFVEKVASTYPENPFHNFEHAAHATMSTQKLLSRIVRPTDILSDNGKKDKTAAAMHDHTFGITSDPLTQLAVLVSALIHDAGHPGVANAVLNAEHDPMSIKYDGQSVAEQQSVDIAFEILDMPEFDDLRNCLYTNENEFNRFRSTIINLVLATDIMDKQLGALRKNRWAKAFDQEDSSEESDDEHRDAVNRKATIVLEHLMQASDVSHTMQHWHVYYKWNEKLFHEMYRAYLAGRIEKDPAESWYKGEIGFFDFYIIPLAKKLETCGVFGVSSHEYLSYAEANRHEWEMKGEEIVRGYLAKYEEEHSEADLIVADDGISVEC